MSHTVVHGKPIPAQLYLDDLLDEVLLQHGIKPDIERRDSVTLPQLLFHCLKREPNALFMINGATEERITNKQILQRAVPLARALVTAGASGKLVMFMMRNHQHMAVVYFAGLFAGVIPFCMDPNTTSYELIHFIELIEPSCVFYDKEHDKLLQEALKNTQMKPTILIVDEPQYLLKFVGACSDDYNSYQVQNALPDDTVLFLPTSGSTGLPKAAALTHRGTVTQIPNIWPTYTKFPTPTELVMILTTMQWGTFTMTIIACVTYHIPILMSPKPNTVENVTQMLEKYRPTWTFFTPAFASSLVQTIKPEQLSSLETIILLGAPPSPVLMKTLKDKLPKATHLCDGYGSTETHGFIALPDKDTPINFNGPVVNCFEYKIVDDNGNQLGAKGTGELWLRGNCIIKKYHKTRQLDELLTPDGWYKTGDDFYLDENGRVSFVKRRKFTFKFRGCQVAPEEVERVISSVSGVRECVVCESDNGPAAAVVIQPHAHVTKENIHRAVNATLSEHKRLHGGIVFVSSLRYIHTGKLNRAECRKMIGDAIARGDCC